MYDALKSSQTKKTSSQNLNLRENKFNNESIGNQAMLNNMGINQHSRPTELEQIMRGRMQSFYSAKQLPSAEAEANSIASLVSNQQTLEGVREELGSKMGADFSGVRFHMGSEAKSTASTIGARAYTTGRDVFLGEEVFDPAIVAHELVHTVQQGVVNSAMSTVSAPAGGVQMVKKGQLPAAPGNLKLNPKGGKGLKGKGVISLPTDKGGDAVVKSTTNPAREALLADFYNTSASVRGQRQKSGWNFDAPVARGLREGEKEGVSKLYQGGTLESVAKGDTPPSPEELLGSTTVFSKVSGQSVQDPFRRKDDKKIQGFAQGADAAEYKKMMGYVSLMDLVAGNSDRLQSMNTDNWMEDRKGKKAHLIDNDFYVDQGSFGYRGVEGETDVKSNQEIWLEKVKQKTGGTNGNQASARGFAQTAIQDFAAPEFSGLFGEETVEGIDQAIGDLPAIREAMQARFEEQKASGAPNAEQDEYQRDLLERLELMHNLFNPPQQAAATSATPVAATTSTLPAVASATPPQWKPGTKSPSGSPNASPSILGAPRTQTPATTSAPTPTPAWDRTAPSTTASPGEKQPRKKFLR